MKPLQKAIWPAFVFMWTIAQAQPPITSIDKVFIERDTSTLAIKGNDITDGDIIVFDIPGIGEFLGEAPETVSDVILTIDGMEMKEFPAFIGDMESGLVKFKFSEDDLTNDHRQKLYNSKGGERKELQLGITIGKDISLTSFPEPTFYFDKIWYWSRVGYGLIGLFVIVFAILIVGNVSLLKANLKSVAGVDPIVNPGEPPAKPAYSFGKTQMAFWTLIVLSSFIYIWAFTGQLDSINTTALILMGITSFTVTAGTVIDSKDTLKAKGDVDVMRRIADSRSTYNNFFKDILSDNDGLSMNRFQAFILNIVFGIAFFKTVIADFAMPSFSETQLLLLGLSSGTYAFLKTTENK